MLYSSAQNAVFMLCNMTDVSFLSVSCDVTDVSFLSVSCDVTDVSFLSVSCDVTDVSFLSVFSSKFHERFVESFSWMTLLNVTVIRLLAQRATDGTFSPSVVRRLLGILQYRLV